MAVTNIYGARSLRAVLMTVGGVNAYYAFKTNVDPSEVSDLGQVAAATIIGSTTPIFVGTGTNGRPRPARLKKKREGITSLAGTANITTALATRKWQLVKRAVYQGRVAQKSAAFGTPIPGGEAAKGSILAVVSTSGLNWAWRIPAQQFNKITTAEATSLGITIPNTDLEFRSLLVRADLPRPARAYRNLVTTDSTLTIETFIGDSATLPAGWTGIGEARKFEG
jgi:hypothetical protein